MIASTLLDRFLPSRHRPVALACLACGKPVAAGDPAARYQSPLGDAMTGEACRECRDLRAVAVEHACWFLTLAGAGSESGCKAWMYLAVDAHGAYYGMPVHVNDAGGYVPIGTWAASPAGVARLARFREERSVRPGEDSRRGTPLGEPGGTAVNAP